MLLFASRLIPLRKPSGGLRPIAVGELIYRVCAKALVPHAARPGVLKENQFGVGSLGGVEPIIHAIDLTSKGELSPDATHVTLLDFSNAFNSCRRSRMAAAIAKYAPQAYWLARCAYDHPAPLIISVPGRDPVVIWSTEGIRQGDPLGPLFFSIAVREEVQALEEFLGPEFKVYVYLDDFVITGPDEHVLDRIQEHFAGRDMLSLNVNKCRTVSLEDIRNGGLELLGSCIGSREARYTFLEAAIDKLEAGIDRLQHIEKQHASLLLRLSLQQKLRHLQRSLPSEDLGVSWERLDMVIYNAARRLAALPHTEDPTLTPQRVLTHLPTRYGGLGLLSYAQCAPLAAQASNNLSLAALKPLFPSVDHRPDHSTQTQLCEEAFFGTRKQLFLDITLLERVLVTEAGTYIGRRALAVIPSSNPLRLDNHAMTTLYRTRLLVPERSQTCSACAQPPTILHNELCPSRNFRQYTRRHDLVKMAIADTLNSIAGCKATIEPAVPPLADAAPGEDGDRRNDVRFTTGGRCKLASMDLDVMITSLARKDALVRSRLAPASMDYTKLDSAVQVVEWALNRQALTKDRRAPTAQPAAYPLKAFVLSTGGAMHGATETMLMDWKKEAPVGTFAFMVNRIALSLVRSRAET